ncbi:MULTISPECIES: glucose-6-phosphate isomerase [unclassified Arthrobacter]|uniref:glucose-6-phosphate isomerase n=1 Tax=unclassified Arthrobacter TaxID=235627 RepID=UPI001E2FFDEA|nr:MULTISPECIES: glucose-6-phosphate isomerase [unclassified Arthrobacter]MCC9145374.1 glucose-6-phosphate isomerase [Arthrobacter sp. zg-Y919]MDK1276602.1 glucose-6-phosphate isomerase [Arthrobacter sp. zg.Y919]WIB01810.1 glucose-6-phosphate isomerase [Arthrobacter sp. zg-Y919]
MTTLSFEAAGAAGAAVDAKVPELVGDEVASRLVAQDPTLWGPDAEAEASIRLGWLNPGESSRPLVGQIAALREELAAESVTRVVLAGMGGSSLAPEVITRSAGVDLTVLDSTDPDVVAAALGDRLAETVIVVSSKSGSTVETDSQRRVFEQAFTDAGIDAKSRIVVVTDPGSPLEAAAREAGYRAVFNADPNVGGRYSALTAFGLVPSGLAGADIESLLDDAELTAEMLRDDAPDNIGLQLGAALGGTEPLRNKIVIVDEGSGLAGFPDWAEQLIAESTGKLGTGLLPVAVEPGAPEMTSGAGDVLTVRIVPVDSEIIPEGDQVVVSGSLGSSMMLWEFATAVAGRLLNINPFDQPDVEAAKKAARGLLDATPEPTEPSFVDGSVEVRGPADLLGTAHTLRGALAALLRHLGPDGYVSVQAYLDRFRQAGLADIRPELATATGRPVTFGWGPRFLHSTGQFHKGGPAQGVYLQITGKPGEDVTIPDRPFTFGELISAQAAGDATVLADQGRPVLRLHLLNRDEGVREIANVVRALATDGSGD